MRLLCKGIVIYVDGWFVILIFDVFSIAIHAISV